MAIPPLSLNFSGGSSSAQDLSRKQYQFINVQSDAAARSLPELLNMVGYPQWMGGAGVTPPNVFQTAAAPGVNVQATGSNGLVLVLAAVAAFALVTKRKRGG